MRLIERGRKSAGDLSKKSEWRRTEGGETRNADWRNATNPFYFHHILSVTACIC